jgi:DNA-binding PucR family transcriptional regulator
VKSPGGPAAEDAHPEPVPERAERRRSTARLATAALQRLDETLPWYRAMPPEDRSWVGLVAQAGISAFTTWFSDPSRPLTITADVFGTAPRELTRSVTLSQTLELVRAVVTVVEDHIEDLTADPDDPAQLSAVREAVLRYSREVAFGAAEVYAEAAEVRGAWDARLEALVVDAVLRGDADDALRSQVAALGWRRHAAVSVVVGAQWPGRRENVVEEVRLAARQAADDALVGLQGDRLVVVLGTSGDPWAAAQNLTPRFGPGAVVVGPTVTDLGEAGRSARVALAGLVAARAWPAAPRPVSADDLLPERVLSGDVSARRALLDRVYRPVQEAGPALADTVGTYLEHGCALEATARTMFVHPNTVRYRLRRVAELTGWDASHPRDAYVLQVALAVGRLAARPAATAGAAAATPPAATAYHAYPPPSRRPDPRSVPVAAAPDSTPTSGVPL